jgi:protein-disulfide isomerase
MLLTRRFMLAAAATAPMVTAARAAETDPLRTERSFGSPTAKVTVTEFFSLTCTHCAAFQRETMPDVTTKLIDTGKVRMVYWDFPLDQVALSAAMVARALPPERYEPFITALFASQDRWAFDRQANLTEELFKRAALAGMSRDTFDKAINDQGLKAWILARQDEGAKKYGIDSTPSFIQGDQKRAGEMDFKTFAQFVGVSATG